MSKNKPTPVILVSGGARGITAQCVIRLAQHAPAKFILIGRTAYDPAALPAWAESCADDSELKKQIMNDLSHNGAKPTPQLVNKQFKNIRAQQEIRATLKTVRELGSEVEYIAADVTDKAALQEKLLGPSQQFGKITGIIHGAGNLADRLIEKKTERDFDTVFTPKVDGLQNLLEIVPVNQLNLLVLFSSVVGFYGNMGQADYAMANEVLNKAAYQVKRENPDCRVISINWGPWDSGMVTPELKRAFASRNMDVIPVEAGADRLAKEVYANISPQNHPVQLIVGSLPTRPASAFDPSLKKVTIRRELNLAANPFLLDHQIGGNPVLPATCAASWAASLCEQIAPGKTLSNIENFKVLKGIVFDENLAKEHYVDLTEIEKTPEGSVTYETLVRSQNQKGRPIYHYSMNVTLQPGIQPIPTHTISAAIANEDAHMIDGKTLYADGTLFHGPSFQGIRNVISLGRSGVLLECMLPALTEKQQGQFPFQTTNPFFFDAIVQSLLIWTQRYFQNPCLPSHLVRLDLYRPIPFDQTCFVEMRVVSANETSIVSDLWVTDDQDRLLVKFTRLQGTISPLLNRFIGVKNNQ